MNIRPDLSPLRSPLRSSAGNSLRRLIHGEPDPNENDKLKVPLDFICPVSNRVMKDPVITEFGFSYERKAILKYIEANGAECPMTHQPLQASDLKDNVRLKDKIARWKQERKDEVPEKVSARKRDSKRHESQFNLSERPDGTGHRVENHRERSDGSVELEDDETIDSSTVLYSSRNLTKLLSASPSKSQRLLRSR